MRAAACDNYHLQHVRFGCHHAAMKLSARNVIQGKVIQVTKGQTTAHVRLDVGGTIITSSITNEAVDDLALKVGDVASAVIKSSDVIIAKD
jgi:molybdopterin-binding protein